MTQNETHAEMESYEIGVISDTHGLLRPEALEALAGVRCILHAGDVGDLDVLEGLSEVAPVLAVRGNVDIEPWTTALPETLLASFAGCHIFMLHDQAVLGEDIPKGCKAIIFGHSHQPLVDWRDNVLYLNPGSAGPRRFTLPVSLVRIRVSRAGLAPRLIELEV